VSTALDAPPAAVGVVELEQWVREHCVTWETRPRREPPEGQDAPAEVELTLLGRSPDGRFPAGDDGYRLVYDRLRAIALQVLESIPGARHRMDPFDAAVRLRPEHDWVPEVELSLVIEEDAPDPSDGGGARRRLAEIESGLERLGAQRGHWRGP
jgi:hypothetical protein